MLSLRTVIFCAALMLAFAGCAPTAAPIRACCRPEVTLNPSEFAGAEGATNSLYTLDSVWQTDAAKDFKLSELRGHPVVISMFFASCEGICVITKDDFKAVEASLPSAVREQTAFVLVTLDPLRDSAAALHQYRMDQGLSAKHWRLLRGSEASTSTLARFLGIEYGRDASGLFRHSSRLVVLDRTGKIVAQQDGTHADLTAAVKTLVALAGP
jgi:protein SCO1/2